MHAPSQQVLQSGLFDTILEAWLSCTDQNPCVSTCSSQRKLVGNQELLHNADQSRYLTIQGLFVG
jgi:hypothetical protein